MARTGRQASERIFVNSYDFVLIDLGLPDYDGFDLLRQSLSAQRDASFLILTASGALDSKLKGLTITDTGPGISTDQIATLIYYGRPPKVTGNGIGLQLIQTIVPSHHIGLTVDSHPNSGTRITL